MERVRNSVDRVLAGLLVVIMGALVIDVLWQVCTRFVLGNPSSYTEEVARYLMIWVGLLGAGYAAGKKMHLAVDLLPRRLRSKGSSTLLTTVIHVCTLVFAVAVLIGGGSRLVWTMLYLGQTSAGLQMPLGFVYLAVPISGALITFYTLCDLTSLVRRGSR